MKKSKPKALIVGLGVSGQGAGMLLCKNGYDVFCFDDKHVEHSSFVSISLKRAMEPFDVVVASPGVCPNHPVLNGRFAISEIELGLRYLPQHRKIGITGTNGKSTLTLLLTHLLNEMRVPARALGNIGMSLAEYAINPVANELLVIELSSYQLEKTMTAGFDYGIITNITPTHLQRYKNFEHYKQTKYHLKNLVPPKNFLDQAEYLERTKNDQYSLIVNQPIFRAAWAMSIEYGISWDDFLKGIETFQRPPHRLEDIGIIHGIHFINDSKSTNLASVIYALERTKKPITLIVCGQIESQELHKWRRPIEEHVDYLVIFGAMAEKLKTSIEFGVVCKDLENAVDMACSLTSKGSTILFSPGGPSFDQFKNFSHRGELFKKYVLSLEKKHD